MKVYTIEYAYPHSNRSNEIWITYQYKRDALNHKEHMEKDDITLVGLLELGSLMINEKYKKVEETVCCYKCGEEIDNVKNCPRCAYQDFCKEEEITKTLTIGDDYPDSCYDGLYDDYSINGIFDEDGFYDDYSLNGIFNGVDGEIELNEPEGEFTE